MLFVVSGPSGVGKSTLCGRLLREFDTLVLSVSFTTRAVRGSEVDGEHYHFVDRPRFEQMIERGEFAEWASVHGNFYGTARAVVDEHLGAGRSLLFDIDYQGAASLRAAYPDDTVTTMLLPPDLAELEARLRARGTDSEQVIAGRLAEARNEIAQARDFDHVVLNDDLERSYDALRSIFVAAGHATRRQSPALARLLASD